MLLENVKNYLTERYDAETAKNADKYIFGQSVVSRRLIDFNYGFISYELKGDACIIYDVYVSPEYRKQGVMKTATKAIKELAIKERKNVLIGISDLNGTNREPGLGLISACGFKRLFLAKDQEVFIQGVA